MKRFIAILLCAVMLVPQAVIGSLAVDEVTLVSMEAYDASPLMENYDGDWREDWDYENDVSVKWFEYEVARANPMVKFTYSNGTTKELRVNEIEGFSFSSIQWSGYQWTAGNTYTATLYYENLECEYTVEIVPSDVESIEINELNTLTEGISGHYNFYYEDQKNQTDPVYYYEYWPSTFVKSIKVNYTDGTSEVLEYEDINSRCFIEATQDYFNQWSAGNDYPASITYKGATCDFDVYITPNNIEKIEICNVKDFVEGIDCYEHGEYVDGEWRYYDYYFPYNAILNEEIRVTYTDGTSEIKYMYYVDEYNYEFLYAQGSEQGYDSQWTAGNTYTVTLLCFGRECEFEINVTEDPIESIEIAELYDVIEGQNGYYTKGWDAERNDYVYYFYYSAYGLVKYVKLNYKDGTSAVVRYDDLDEARIYSDQSYDNQWTVGNTYTATLEYGKYSCEFEVTVQPNNIESIVVNETSALIEGIDDEIYLEYCDGEWVQYLYYDPENAVDSITINYTDGTSEIKHLYSINDYAVTCEQDYYNQWTEGNTYTATLMYAGRTCDFEVNVIADPVVSIEVVETATITAGTHGRYLNEYNEELGEEVYFYAYYSEYLISTLRINYADGTYEDVNFSDFFCNTDCWLEYDQRYENQWVAGQSYPATVHYGNHSCDFEVYIAPNNIASIMPYELRNFREGYDCYTIEEYDPKTESMVTYNYYYVDNVFDGVLVTYDDGSTEVVYPWWYDYVIISNQSYDNQWTAGNSYSVTLMLMGETCTFEVYIETDPVESIEIYELNEIFEEIDGYFDTYYDYENGETYEYYYYPADIFIKSLKINYNDGTSEIVDLRNFENYDIVSDQGYYNQWVPGNEYTITLNSGNHQCSANVEILPSPVESIEVIDVKDLMDGTDSYIAGDWIFDMYVEYTCYDPFNAINQIKVNYKDGTSSIFGNGDINFSISYEQDYYNQWTVGNTYPVTVSYGGKSTVVNVSVVENPIANIEVYETRPLEENTYGWWHYYNDELGVEHQWFQYSPSDAIVSLLITYKDGTSEVVDRDYMTRWSTSDDQSYMNPWTVGNTYPATIEFNGFEMNFEVSIVEYCPFDYFVQDGGAFITGVKSNQYFEDNDITDFVIPSEINGIPVIGITYINGWCNNVKTLTIPASVIYISDWALQEFFNVETVYIEGAETFVCPEAFGGMNSVKEFVLNEENTKYVEIDGVIFDKDITTIKAYPLAKGYTYELPATISDLSFQDFYTQVEFIIHPDSVMFVTENGITYNKDKTQIISCDKTVSGDYVMPDTVESIAAMLFEDCDNLTSIKISSKVTEIAYATFAGCDNLKSVILPESLEYIGGYAFSECTALEGIQLPDGLDTIDYRAFLDSGLKSLTIPGSVIYLGRSSFYGSGLETLTIEASTTKEGLEIESSAFANNTSLKTVVLGEGLYYLGTFAFEDCTSLESINIPDSLGDGIGGYVFANCDSLTYLPIGKNQTIISYGLFYDCDGLVDITIPEGIVYIDDSTFESCSNLKNVVIPDSAELFGDYIFAYCTSLEYAPIGASQTYVSSGEFCGCTGIKEFIVPERITEICNNAFLDCTKLNKVEVHDGITYIGSGAFSGCTDLKNFDTGDGIDCIYSYTFANSGIKDITIGNKVGYIGYQAFTGSALENVTIPSNVTEIAYYAFYNCESLSNITMPETLVSLGGHSFDETKWYDKQPEGTVYLGTSVYTYKGDIPEGTDKELYIKEGTLSIAAHAFENWCIHTQYFDLQGNYEFGESIHNMSGLKAVHVPEGLIEIGEYAFIACEGLTEIYLPASLEEIEGEAFVGCDALTTIYYGGSEEQWAAINKTYGNEILNNCEIVYNYVDEAPEMVTVTVDGVEEEVAVGETLTFETEKLTYDPETGKAYVFLEWVVNGADVTEVSDGTIKVTVSSADVSVTKNAFVHGNADGDDEGIVNAFDIISTSTRTKSDEYSIYSDINFDGKVTAIDIIELCRIIKGAYNYEE